MNENPHILISGAGIAGLTLAYWLKEFGFSPTVIEKRADLNDKGYMIDFYGSGFDVAEKMGLVEKLKARHYPMKGLVLVDQAGQQKAILEVDKFRELLHFRHFNFMRGDLESVLHEAVKGHVPIRFKTSIQQIDVQPDSVAVEFTDGSHESFDLVIGADGIHSRTRKLVWGDESQFEHFLGFYIACSVVDTIFENDESFYSYLEPHKQVSVYSIGNQQCATLFAIQLDKQPPLNHEEQLNVLTQVCGNMKWKTAEIIAATKQSPQFYFDAVSQIKVPTWFNGRVALVGDAAYCLTLLAGQGASMAMAGAYLLATALKDAKGDHEIAFRAYQTNLKPEIDQRQVEAQKLTKSFVPNSQFAIWMVHTFMKFAFLPGIRTLFLRQIGAKSLIK